MEDVENGRSPSGERGLKFGRRRAYTHCSPSLPIRGAWIEIVPPKSSRRLTWSLPIRGAWIEIFVPPPCGADR